MQNIKYFWVLFSIFFISILACSPIINSPKVITDDLGRSITIEKIPKKIVSLSPSSTEILFALGVGEKIVGVTEICDYPPEAREKEKIGGIVEPDIKKIISLSPDLILVTTNHHQRRTIPKLEEKGLKVSALAPKTLDEILKDIMLVGKITEKEKEAAEIVSQMKRKIKAIAEKTKHIPESQKPRVFWIAWPEPLWTVGEGTFTHDLILKAGGKNITWDTKGCKPVSLDVVTKRNPQIIIGSTAHGKLAQWAKNNLKNTEAYKNNRIYVIKTELVDRPGPRIVKGLEIVAKCIHPEIFGEPRLEELHLPR